MKIELGVVDEAGDTTWHELEDATYQENAFWVGREVIVSGAEALDSVKTKGTLVLGTGCWIGGVPATLDQLARILSYQQPLPTRTGQGKGRKAHKAFQRKLGGGW